MKKEELIKAIQDNNLKDQQVLFVTEDTGLLFFPVMIRDNQFVLMLDKEYGKHMFEKVVKSTLSYQNLLDHLQSYNNSKELYAVDITGNENSYFFTGVNFEDEETLSIYIKADYF